MAFQTRYARFARAFSTVLVLLCAAACWPGAAWAAHTSPMCAAKSGTVANGSAITIDVTDCGAGPGFFATGPVDGPALPQNGTANLREVGNTWVVDYSHNGSATTSDVFEFTDAEASGNGGTVRVTITITPANSSIVVTPASLPTLTAGTPLSQALSATGGTAPYTFSVVGGTLPPGLTLSGGVISGAPTQRGAYSFTVRATDSTLATVDKAYGGTVQNPSLSLASPNATAIQGVPFSQTLATNGGVAPHTYALESGAFPAGVTISSGGVISGTTSAAVGNYPVTLRVTDSSTGPGSYFEVEPFTLTVSPAPSVSIAVSPASVSEDGATNLVYTVTRSLTLSSPTVVNLTTGGTATSGVDYTGAVTSVTIPANATTATVTIDPVADSTVEANETVIITVAAGSGYTVGAPSSATGTILNDDVPSASIAVSPASVVEDSGTPLVYTVTLNQPSLSPLSINFTVGGSATSGTDHAAVTSPLVIAAGATTGTVTVTPIADSVAEANETVVLSLAAGAGYVVGTPSSATGTIVDDDQPTLSINDVSLNEGNSGTTSFTFTVSLSAPAGPGGVSFDIATADGTATAGSDYVAKALVGQVIPAGSSTYAFTVLVNGDTLNEPNEAFVVNVSNVAGATVADAQAVGTIINDDALPTLSINDVTVTEGNAGTTTATLTVSLSAASAQTVSVNYFTANGTAVAPADYTSASGTLSFAPGMTTQTLTVLVNGDTTPEADETFVVNLAGAINATLSDAQGVVTILNDDQAVTVGPTTLPDPAAGVSYSQTIVASGGSGSYTYAITSGAVPAGLSLNAGGVLAGTPTATGAYSFTVTATDTSAAPGPYTGSRAYSGSVGMPTLTLPAGALPGATRFQAYTATAGPASGGTAPYTFTITAGSLPAGVSMDGNGTFSGTPTALGTYNFVVTATDSTTGTGAPYGISVARSITVADSLPVAGPVSATIAYGAPSTPITLVLSGGAASSVAVDALPAHGTATVIGPTAISYQPATGFAGSDSFTYTASNGTGSSAPATVSITVGNPTITVTANGVFSAVAGTAYSQTFTWAGGAAPYSGFQVSNLPAGLSITASTADSVTVSGTPTQAGSFNLLATAIDSSTGNGPFTTAQGFVLTVASPTLAVTPATLQGTSAGTAYQQAISATGGVAPYTYVLGGALPAGLAFDAATGVLSGTPSQSGSFALNLEVTDSTTGTPATVTQSYTLQVASPTLVLTPAAGTLPATVAGSAYQQVFASAGGVAPYRYAVSAGALPAGLVLDANSGQVTGTPMVAGSSSFSITATDSTTGTAGTVTQAYTLTVQPPVLALAPATLASGAAGVAFEQAFTASGGIAPYQYSVAGALPAGLSLDASSGVLSGTPTQAGSFPLSVTANDSTGGTAATVTQAYTLQVAAPQLELTPAAGALPQAQAGTAYQQVFSSSGGIAPYTYAVSAGALPAGLVLDAASGRLSGTATAAGSNTFSITATDSTTGTPGAATQAYTLSVQAPELTLTPATLPAGLFGSAYQQVLSTSGGTAPYRYAVTAGSLPTGLVLSADGQLSGTPEAAGAFSLTITATDALGFTGQRDYQLQIAQRPDPTRDAEVRGLLDAQADAARRFATSQIENFQQRMQRLHGASRNGGFSNTISLAAADRTCDRTIGAKNAPGCEPQRRQPFDNEDAAAPPPAGGVDSNEGALGFWTGGSLRSGRTTSGRASGSDFQTDGLTLGADYRLGDAFAIGAGIGYGRDRSDVGQLGSRSDGQAYTLAIYGSYSPGQHVFVDVLLGRQLIDYTLRRYVTSDGSYAQGRRDGQQWFGSLALGTDFVRGAWQFTPYARLDASHGTLDAFIEQGSTLYVLAFADQQVQTTTGNAGLRMEVRNTAHWGRWTPQFKVEYQHDFKGSGVASMQYADSLDVPFYRTTLDGFERNRWLLGAGVQFDFRQHWGLRVDYRGLVGSDDRDHGVQISLDKKL